MVNDWAVWVLYKVSHWTTTMTYWAPRGTSVNDSAGGPGSISLKGSALLSSLIMLFSACFCCGCGLAAGLIGGCGFVSLCKEVKQTSNRNLPLLDVFLPVLQQVLLDGHQPFSCIAVSHCWSHSNLKGWNKTWRVIVPCIHSAAHRLSHLSCRLTTQKWTFPRYATSVRGVWMIQYLNQFPLVSRRLTMYAFKDLSQVWDSQPAHKGLDTSVEALPSLPQIPRWGWWLQRQPCSFLESTRGKDSKDGYRYSHLSRKRVITFQTALKASRHEFNVDLDCELEIFLYQLLSVFEVDLEEQVLEGINMTNVSTLLSMFTDTSHSTKQQSEIVVF